MGDRDNSPSSTIRTGVGRRPTQINHPEQPNRTKLDTLISHRETLGQGLFYAEGGSRGCSERRDWYVLYPNPTNRCFDSGAAHCFISVKLIEMLELVPTRKSLLLSTILPDRLVVMCEELYGNCPIRIYEHEFLADLYMFELIDFGAILGTDWLAKYQAQIDCPK